MKTTAKTKSVKETDLYPLLKSWLEANGYTVHAEVLGCDVAARRGDELVLVELKRAINLDLLLQLVKRQEADAAVYAAVPAPATTNRRWRELVRLLKRLEAGLIVIYHDSARPRVELVFHPIPQERRKTKRATRAILKELSGRSVDMNVGGSRGRALMTAYRESCLHVAAALAKLGPCSPKTLRAAGAPERTGAILFANHYSWFERVEKGVYRLAPAGAKALGDHAELAGMFVVGEG